MISKLVLNSYDKNVFCHQAINLQQFKNKF